MSTLWIALLLRPFAAIVFFGLIVIPIELLLRRFWPEGSLKRILFDRTFQHRHPKRFLAIWWGLIILVIGWIALVIYVTGGTL